MSFLPKTPAIPIEVEAVQTVIVAVNAPVQTTVTGEGALVVVT